MRKRATEFRLATPIIVTENTVLPLDFDSPAHTHVEQLDDDTLAIVYQTKDLNLDHAFVGRDKDGKPEIFALNVRRALESIEAGKLIKSEDETRWFRRTEPALIFGKGGKTFLGRYHANAPAETARYCIEKEVDVEVIASFDFVRPFMPYTRLYRTRSIHEKRFVFGKVNTEYGIATSEELAKLMIEAPEQLVVKRIEAIKRGRWTTELVNAKVWHNAVGSTDDPEYFEYEETDTLISVEVAMFEAHGYRGIVVREGDYAYAAYADGHDNFEDLIAILAETKYDPSNYRIIERIRETKHEVMYGRVKAYNCDDVPDYVLDYVVPVMTKLRLRNYGLPRFKAKDFEAVLAGETLVYRFSNSGNDG